ncbi:MAG TPA: T9SS type A sorting domain-containing protein [Bacteroidia bacterium]|nr:T9SS type A sorting domain-containing protein [Bacteroidia bacterium]
MKNNNSADILDSLIFISTFGDSSRFAYNYNDDLSLSYFTYVRWLNGEWINFGKNSYTYNSDGNLESVLEELFNESPEEWIKNTRDVYNYDSLGNRIFSLRQYFNGQEFVNNFKSENCFEGKNLISSVRQDWTDNEWVNSSKSIYTYTPEKVKVTALFQVWANEQWVNYGLTNYGYDEMLNVNTIQSKTWQENQWIDYALGLFEYGDYNNLIIENWLRIVNNNRENWFRIFYEYDDDNNLVHLYGEEWINNQWVPENEPLKVTNPAGILYSYLAKEVFLYYSKPTSVGYEKNIANEFNLSQNYPNPFNSTTIINYTIPSAGVVKLKIFDILGNEITELVNEYKFRGNYSIKFTDHNLSSGVYIYTLKINNVVKSRSMILLK